MTTAVLDNPPAAPAFSTQSILRFAHGSVTFDQRAGIGSVSDVENIEYLGFIALVRPSVYLELTPPLVDADSAERLESVLSAVDEGLALGMPFLKLSLDEPVFQIHDHEGRHRMAAVLERCGDDPAPVAVLLAWDRARHVTADHLARFCAGAKRERSAIEPNPPFIDGPLFEEVVILGERIQVEPTHRLRHTP